MAVVEEDLQRLTAKFNATKCIWKVNYVAPGDVREFEDSCGCKPVKGVLCGETCEHRLLNMNCHVDCHAEGTCDNQFLRTTTQKEGLVLCHTKEMGIGVRTCAKILKDEYVISYIGELIDKKTYDRRLKSSESPYGVYIKPDVIMDNIYYGNISRFLNHNCEPNLRLEIWHLDNQPIPMLWAEKDILMGEQLFFDYNLEEDPDKPFHCLCGTRSCRYQKLKEAIAVAGINDKSMDEKAVTGFKRKPREEKAVTGFKRKPREEKAVTGFKRKPREEKAVTGFKRKPREEKAVTGIKRKPVESVTRFYCVLCTKNYPKKQSLDQHYAGEHKVTWKPINYDRLKENQCSECKMVFRYPSLKEDHAKTHLNVLLAFCEPCDKWFKSEKTLKAHRSKVHKENVYNKKQFN